MTEHLPECHLFLEPLLSAQDWCICNALRACEERVLDAAREAVAACTPDRPSMRGMLISVNDALSAIDALRKDHR